MSSTQPSGGDLPRTVHQPVLVRETLRLLDLSPGLVVVDGTVGGGGHSRHILQQIEPGGTLIGLDRDPTMIQRAAQALNGPNCRLINTDYSQIRHVLDDLNVDFADRILLDLGLSSDQLADDDRGFSFSAAGPLDLRFDTTEGIPAWEFLQSATEEQLESTFREYGEEPHSKRIAAELVRRRSGNPIRTATELADLVRDAVPSRKREQRHPATRVFQALRIAVNDELKILEQTLHEVLHETLRTGGRAVVITFHSLEDRLVKTAFRDKSRWENLTTKPITATATEMKVNPRSRTAKIRAAVRKDTAT